MFNWFGKKQYTKEEEQILNVGLNIAAKRLSRPIQKELQEQFPGLTTKQLDEYNSICQKVANFGFNEVHKLVRTKGTSLKVKDLKPKVTPKYPWVTDDNILSLITFGIYMSER